MNYRRHRPSVTARDLNRLCKASVPCREVLAGRLAACPRPKARRRRHHRTLSTFAWSFVGHSNFIYSLLSFGPTIRSTAPLLLSEAAKMATQIPKSDSKNSSRSQGPTVSSWSCFNCRKRKSRCNRQSPCGFCFKAGVECLYPFTGRMPIRQHNSKTVSAPSSRAPPPQKQSKAQVQELLSRLRQLENVMGSLNLRRTDAGDMSPSKNGEGSTAEEEGAPLDTHTNNMKSPHDLSHTLSKSFGSLHACESGTIYTGNSFWTALHGEVIPCVWRNRMYQRVFPNCMGNS